MSALKPFLDIGLHHQPQLFITKEGQSFCNVERNEKLPLCSGFPGGSVVKNPPANARDVVGLIPESRRSPGVGNGNPLQYSCLGNPMDRGT